MIIVLGKFKFEMYQDRLIEKYLRWGAIVKGFSESMVEAFAQSTLACLTILSPLSGKLWDEILNVLFKFSPSRMRSFGLIFW